MNKKPFLCKLVFGMALITFILPIKAPVAFAEARLCCKIFCSHKMKSMETHDHGSMKNCGKSEMEAVDCCQDHCPSILATKNSQTVAAVSFLPGVPLLKWEPAFLAANFDGGLQEYPLRYHFEFWREQIKAPPLFLLQSVFLL